MKKVIKYNENFEVKPANRKPVTDVYFYKFAGYPFITC